MAVDATMQPELDSGFLNNPMPALITGLVGCAGAALVSSSTPGDVPTGPRLWIVVILLVAGLLGAGIAVAIRPRSSVVLGLAAFAAFVASLATDSFDSDGLPDFRILLRGMAALAGFSALVMLMPSVWRRAAVSLMILFHFGGILTAVISASPQPWIAGRLWVVVYRPYLQFMYLNNAYHFYSPEPGPASLLWFRIEYERDADGKNWRWVKVPDFDEDTGQPKNWPRTEYTRRLSLTESTVLPSPAPSNDELERRLRLRQVGGMELGIPLHPEIPWMHQYGEPNILSKRWLSVYAKHVAQTYKHEQKPDLAVTGVKIYRVTHQIILQPQINAGMSPTDLSLYWPYFMGEFDKEGVLKDPKDPFLYWLIPIQRTEEIMKQQGDGPLQPFRAREVVTKNYLLIHAGDMEADK